jgi:hypothetical protein
MRGPANPTQKVDAFPKCFRAASASSSSSLRRR